MDDFWIQSMQQECEQIVRPEKGKSLGRRRTATETNRGRIWACCVSCAGVVVSWEPEKTDGGQGEVRVEGNGFTLMICGRCERKNGQIVSTGEKGSIRICKEMIVGSEMWRGISEHCSSKGWKELELRSERVVDRRVLFGRGLDGMRAASVIVERKVEGERGGEEWSVKVMDYVETGFM
jgi:hypothetical protein